MHFAASNSYLMGFAARGHRLPPDPRQSPSISLQRHLLLRHRPAPMKRRLTEAERHLFCQVARAHCERRGGRLVVAVAGPTCAFAVVDGLPYHSHTLAMAICSSFGKQARGGLTPPRVRRLLTTRVRIDDLPDADAVAATCRALAACTDW